MDLDIVSIHLLTNNPKKVAAVRAVFGPDRVVQICIPSQSTPHNRKYLSEKVTHLGHRGLLTSVSETTADSTLPPAHTPDPVTTRAGGAPLSVGHNSINAQSFELAKATAGAKWYTDHGWVVIRDFMQEGACRQLVGGIEAHKRACAAALDIPFTKYNNEISQHRDLFLASGCGGSFLSVLRQVAMQIVLPITGWSGCTLLHDHVVNKPHGGCNHAIPWHQDSMFWPVDRPGVSVWLALDDVGPRGGCLEVAGNSHKDKVCSKPVGHQIHKHTYTHIHPYRYTFLGLLVSK